MDPRTAWTRAARGMREEAGLHVVAISSLTIAFLCLGAALLGITNLSALADAWGRNVRLTVFLRDGASPEAVAELRLAVEGLAEVQETHVVTSAEARALFVRDAERGSDLSALPDDAFPASLDIDIAPGVAAARVDALAGRLAAFSAVEDVETYRGWFARLESLLTAGRSLAALLALVVVLSVVFVVGNTIRLAVAGRRDEIEVMKLCGASDGFVRGPFVVEGAVQGTVAAGLALGILLGGFALLRGHVDGAFAILTGTHVVFLPPLAALLLVVGGAVLGAAGSVLSLRRYLAV